MPKPTLASVVRHARLMDDNIAAGARVCKVLLPMMRRMVKAHYGRDVTSNGKREEMGRALAEHVSVAVLESESLLPPSTLAKNLASRILRNSRRAVLLGK